MCQPPNGFQQPNYDQGLVPPRRDTCNIKVAHLPEKASIFSAYYTEIHRPSEIVGANPQKFPLADYFLARRFSRSVLLMFSPPRCLLLNWQACFLPAQLWQPWPPAPLPRRRYNPEFRRRGHKRRDE